MKRPVLWTQEETQILLKMKAAGARDEAVAIEVKRTVHGVKERLRWINLTEDQKVEYRKRKNATRGGRGKKGQISAIAKLSYPAHIFEDRAKRYATAPRDLTASFFGDPLPGQSALDRRQSA